MELLLINHPLDCPVCDKGGECPLQNQAMANGRASSRFTEVKRTFPKPIRISTQVLLDRERCILCQRCTRFSQEIAGDPFIDLQMRGAHQQIGTFSPGILGYHVDLPDPVVRTSEELEPTPVRAPVHVAAPATGWPSAIRPARTPPTPWSAPDDRRGPAGRVRPAVRQLLLRQHRADLPGRRAHRRGLPVPLPAVRPGLDPGVCEHCATGCALRVDHRRGKVMRRLAADDPEVNEEWNCDKGRWAFTWSTGADRLTHPLLRDRGTGELEPVSWPEALEAAAAGLSAARDAGGVGVLPGGRLTVEDAYAYAKFARVVLRTNDIDFRARPHSAEEEFPRPPRRRDARMRRTYADLEAAPAVLLVGFEPEEESRRSSSCGCASRSVRPGGGARHSSGARAGRGKIKLQGRGSPTAPGGGAASLGRRAVEAPLSAPGSTCLGPGHRPAGRVRARRRAAGPTGPGRPGGPRRGAGEGGVEGGHPAEPAAGRSPGGRSRGPGGRRRGLGRREPTGAGRPRPDRGSSRPRRPGASAVASWSAASTSTTCRIRLRAGPRCRRHRSCSCPRCGQARSPSSPTSSCRWRRRPRRAAAT